MFSHIPVLAREVVDVIRPQRGGVYLDATVGGGGHSRLLLEANPRITLYGLDQDPRALEAASHNLHAFGDSFRPKRGNFRQMDQLIPGPLDGILMDIGVSSPQLDEAERGFSFHQEAPLDMRMDPEAPLTAREIVNTWSREDLTQIISEYGEERWASRIAEFMVQWRQRRPLDTTGDLVEVIKAAIPASARRGGPHPARRTFQALRIAVNDELGALQEGMDKAFCLLRPGGRLLIITFHSLEDRMVKQAFKAWAQGCTCPKELPVCVCHQTPMAQILTKRPITADPSELEENPRSRSAKLRAVEKIGKEGGADAGGKGYF